MKIFFFLIISSFFLNYCFSQNETNTEMIRLVNFVRQEPQRFLVEVALPYIQEHELDKSSYSKSLVRTLKTHTSLPPLIENKQLMLMAADYASEAGKKGWIGHIRTDARFKKYAPDIDITGENLQFGSKDALAVVMDLLIDQDVRNLGHRKNILDPDFTEIGVAFGNHKSYDTIGVMVFGGFD